MANQAQQPLPWGSEKPLNLPKFVDEDHCLLRYPGLPKVETKPMGDLGPIVCYQYSVNRKHKRGKRNRKSADGSGEAYVSHPLSDFWVIRSDAGAGGQGEFKENTKLGERDFPAGTGADRLRVIQLPRCSIPLAKAVIETLAHGIESEDEKTSDQAGSNQAGLSTPGHSSGTVVGSSMGDATGITFRVTPGHPQGFEIDAQTWENYLADGVDPRTRSSAYAGQAPLDLNIGDPLSRRPDTARHSVMSTESQNSTRAPSTANATIPAAPDPDTPSPARVSFEIDEDSDTQSEEGTLPITDLPVTREEVAKMAATVVGSPNLINRQISGFLTGISLKACDESKDPHLSLFVAVPYLSQSEEGGITLSEYNGSPSSSSEGNKVFVHQAWFYVPNNETIAVFKSHGINEAPLFHYQQRYGAYHALSQMLLATFSTTFSTNTLHNTSHLHSAAAVVLDQIKVLEDLTRLYRNNLSRKNDGGLLLPVLSTHGEQISCALKTMAEMMAERKAEVARLEMIMGGNVGEIQRAQQNRKETERLADAMEKQGETISLFTLITAMFLPLNFMATFFGMNPPNWKGIISTAWQFWAISGPITLIVTIALSVFLFHDDKRMKTRLRKWLHMKPDGPENESKHSGGPAMMSGGSG